MAEESGKEECKLLRRALIDPAKLDVYALAEQLQKVEATNFVLWMQQWCYDLISLKLANTIRYAQEHSVLLNKVSFTFEPDKLLSYQKELLAAQREAMHTLNHKLFFESILLSYKHALQPGPGTN